MSEVKLVVFDCDGTLVDSGHTIVTTMTAVWQREGLAPPETGEIRRQIGLPLLQAITNLHPDADEEVLVRMAEVYRKVSFETYQKGLHNEPLFDGCAAILEDLASDDAYVLGVATGKGRRGLNITLSHHGIHEHFTVLKTADDGPGKPNPDILLDAMVEIGASPWNTVVIGDTIFDIAMAVRAKAHAIGVSWGYHPPHELERAGARAVADNFDEIPALLDQLWSNR